MFVLKKKSDIVFLEERVRELERNINDRLEELANAVTKAEAQEARADALSAEVIRLADLLTAKSGNCKVGPWCKDCQHMGKESAEYHFSERKYRTGPNVTYLYPGHGVSGEVIFCKKHIHEICGEFEKEPPAASGGYPVPPVL